MFQTQVDTSSSVGMFGVRRACRRMRWDAGYTNSNAFPQNSIVLASMNVLAVSAASLLALVEKVLSI